MKRSLLKKYSMSTEEQKLKDKAAADKAKLEEKTPKVQKNPFEKGIKKGKTKIEFLKSPTGVFNLGYSAGSQCSIDASQAEILIDSGYAKKI